MYIMIVARGCPSARNRLFGIFELDQAKALAAAGHKVVFAAVDVRSVRRWRRWGITVGKADGVLLYTISIPAGNIPLKLKTRITVSALRRLYNRILKDQGRPDLMHAHFTDMANAAARLKIETGLPLVVTEHSSEVQKPDIDLDIYDKAVYAYSKADTLIAVSPSLRQVIHSKFGIDAVYIPDMVDSGLFRLEEHDAAVPRDMNDSSDPATNGTFRFVSVGNLVQSKRMDLLIGSFAKAFAGKTGVSLTIFGDGSEREKLAGAISGLGLQEQIHLMGQTPREEIAAFLKGCSCFALASQSETFGVAYIEALACGVPVIACRSGGPESFVNASNGILVPVNDLEKFTSAMETIYKNRNGYDRRKISDDTLALFSPEHVASQLTAVYKRIGEMSRTHSAYGRRES